MGSPNKSHNVKDYYSTLIGAVDMRGLCHELLGERITKQSDHEMHADCPRHESQSKQSLVIDITNKLWNDFGCGLGGDALHLVEFVKFGKVTKGGGSQTHREARDWLADHLHHPRLGTLDKTPEEIAKIEEAETERQQIFEILTGVTELYHKALLDNADVQQWLFKKYGFTKETIEREKLGWADPCITVAVLEKRGFNKKSILATGLFTPGANGEFYPFFNKRVVIPTFRNGKVVYISGRKTDWTEVTRYETMKYKKLRVHNDKDHKHISPHVQNCIRGEDILSTRPKSVIFTEAPMDAISARQFGFASVSMGSVTIPEEIVDELAPKLRGIDKAIIVFDNEVSGAGNEGALRFAERLQKRGIESFIVTLPRPVDAERAFQDLRAKLGAGVLDRLLTMKVAERKIEIDGIVIKAKDDGPAIRDLIERSKVDLCDWFRLGGSVARFEELLSEAPSYLTHLINEAKNTADNKSRDKTINKILDHAFDEDPLNRDRVLDDVTKKLNINKSTIRDMIRERKKAHEAAERRMELDTEKPPPQPPAYATENGGICLIEIKNESEVHTPLTNFVARITAEIEETDGAESKKLFEITGEVGPEPSVFAIPAQDFESLDWVIPYLGPQATMYVTVPRSREHVRAAIQQLGSAPEKRKVYSHLGWRAKDDGEMMYMFSGGAIDKNGMVENVKVRVPNNFAGFVLPPPPDRTQLQKDIETILPFVNLGGPQLGWSLLSVIFRAPLGTNDVTVYLVGGSGVYKSSVAAIAQGAWNPTAEVNNLPAGFSSTANAIGYLQFIAKDTLMVTDDWLPKGSTQDIQRANRDADRTFRGQANGKGRDRLKADGSIRASRDPRGSLLVTGEDVPTGTSLRGRLWIIEIQKEQLTIPELIPFQSEPFRSALSRVLAGYIQYLATRILQKQGDMQNQFAKIRERFLEAAPHARMPSNAAQLFLGAETFFDFALEVEAVSPSNYCLYLDQCQNALLQVSNGQAAFLEDSDVCDQFQRLIKGALVSGKAHLKDKNGNAPPPDVALAVGWENKPGEPGCMVPKGEQAGWIDNESIYFNIDVAHRIANQSAVNGSGIGETAFALTKRLADRGLLASHDKDKNTTKKTLQGARRTVLHLWSEFVLGDASETEESAPEAGAIPGTQTTFATQASREHTAGC